MRGSIRQKSKNSWQIVVDVGTDAEGRRQRHFKTVRGRKGDAQRELNELLSNLDKGTYAVPGKMTVSDIFQQWVQGYVRTKCSPRTQDGYQSIIDNHLAPSLGYHRLKKLTPQVIQSYYANACQALSSRTVHHQHRVLSQALRYAVRQGYLGRNPCELVDPPSPQGKGMRTMDPAEVTAFLEHAEGSFFYPVFYTAVSSGLRQAELLGLRWRDLDLGVIPSISVNRVLYKRRGVSEFRLPKTSRSRRLVSMTPALAAYLREYRQERKALYDGIGKELTPDELVFANHEGQSLNPPSLSRDFARIINKAGIEGVRFHDLRHTFASLALKQGIHPKIISEALGHASVAFTMDTYSHIIEGMQAEAMARLGEVLPAGRSANNSVAKLSPPVNIKLSRN